MSSTLLTLLAPPDLEERIVDWLLARDDVPGFTAFPAHGHGTSHGGLTLAEQVAGRRARHVFQVVLPLATARDVLAALAAELGDAELHYWLQPVLETGPLARRGAPDG
jgi:hypothetical protein